MEIDDFDPGVVKAMLRFMYSFDYPDFWNNLSRPASSRLTHHAQVYEIAVKFGIPALKSRAKSCFEAAISNEWSSTGFLVAIRTVYGTETLLEDRELPDLILKTSRKNLVNLLELEGFCQLLSESPVFTAELFPFLRKKLPPTIRCYECPSCDYIFHGQFTSGSYYCPKCAYRSPDWGDYCIDEESGLGFCRGTDDDQDTHVPEEPWLEWAVKKKK